MAPFDQLKNTEPPIRFSPDWGSETWHLWKLIAATQAGELQGTLQNLLQTVPSHPTDDQLRVAYSSSLLADILRAGGDAWVRDSQLMVSWPNWDGEKGRNFARAAMSAAKDMRDLTAEEVQRVRPLFARNLEGEELALILAEGQFSLQSANERHPTGILYQEAFGAALRYWSMPYRGRTGRMKRFVLTAKHKLLGDFPVVAAILELGDEAPFCTWRDELLGLSPTSFENWLKTQPVNASKTIQDRLRAIRSSLRGTSLAMDIANDPAADIFARKAMIEKVAQGRSQVHPNEQDLLKDRKRMAYGLRLARGEFAFEQISKGADATSLRQEISAGVRALHDLMLPRVHLEATVCGAIPPFSQALGGKLIVSFLSHPDVVNSTLGAEGELLGWSFDPERLDRYLPSHGMLCITTKGLYAKHAAIYTRSDMPGADKPLRLRHLANTGGVTTTLVSDQTTRYARALLDSTTTDVARVSQVYGSGGAKRHRAIETATTTVGLPARIAMAGIRRPVYGLKFVQNTEAVCWLGDQPKWNVRRDETNEEFDARATETWRNKWLKRAIERIQDYAIAPSLIGMLENPNSTRAIFTEDEAMQ